MTPDVKAAVEALEALYAAASSDQHHPLRRIVRLADLRLSLDALATTEKALDVLAEWIGCGVEGCRSDCRPGYDCTGNSCAAWLKQRALDIAEGRAS